MLLRTHHPASPVHLTPDSPEQLCPRRRLVELPASLIVPAPNQPRRLFSPEELSELTASIVRCGILQPLTVRLIGDPPRYTLIAGERRLRAAKLAGLTTVPCVILEADDPEAALLGLVENLQRKDLDCFEEAEGYRRLGEQFGFSQSEIARQVGKSQPAVANKLRLLHFSPEQIAWIREAELSERHARAVLRLPPEQYDDALACIVRQQLTVAQTEAMVEQRLADPPEEKHVPKPRMLVKDVRIFLNTINRALRTMQDAGMSAECLREDAPEGLTLTIRIPRKQHSSRPAGD